MTIRRTLWTLLLCLWTSQAAWADPTLQPGAPAPASLPGTKSGGVRAAPGGGLPRRPDPASKFERPGTGRPVPDGARVPITDSSAGDLSRNLLITLQILRHRFQ
jgi:hypothetical protein